VEGGHRLQVDPGQQGLRRGQHPEPELRRQPRPRPSALRRVPRAAEGQGLVSVVAFRCSCSRSLIAPPLFIRTVWWGGE
jgi:hypothetical protein